MQLDERVLSSCDVTGLVKNASSLCTFFFSTRDTSSALVGSEINAATFHDAIMTLQFLQLMLRRFARLNFVLAFIAAQTAVTAALSPRVVSFATMRFRAFSASNLSAVCRFASSLLCEYAISCSRYAVSNGLIPRSPLVNRFSKRVPGPQNWYPGICSSKGNAFIARFNKPLDDIRHNSLSEAPVRRYAFDDSANCSAASTESIVVPPNRLILCSGSLSHNTSIKFSNSRSSIIFGIYSNFFYVKLCRSSDMMRNILITERFHSTHPYK
ncbi:hypothetical protein ALC60_13275 [Trachymyrmex zeteki]|uniref:Uncharacterized protein n=1 Tax=Mycetomoellerius zeteki TaxID=64791 RepID=A0A151WIM7_9HYME|nr:hypothetical protein ALC60_13275 [Trachymyrmex zeteki]